MVRPSNPLLMSVVLDAIENLSDRKGSTVRDIIDFVRQNSKGSFRNLTMQVRRALKHAVNASLLRHRGGRYKILLSINPISVQQSVVEDSKFNDGLTDKLPNESAERLIRSIKNSNSKKQSSSKQTRRKRIANRSREYTRSRKCVEPKEKGRITRKQKRKAGGKDEENDDWLPVRRKQFSQIMQDDLLPSNDHSYEKLSDYDSDITDENSYDKSTNSKNKFYSRDEECLLSPERKRSPIKQEQKEQSSKVRSRKRSSSRNRTLQRSNYNQNQNEQQQLEIEELPNDNLEDRRIDCEQVSGNVEHIDMELSNPEVDRDRKPNNSGSGSTF